MSTPKQPTVKRPVRLTLELSGELNERLEQLAVDAGGSKSEVLRKAIALFEVAARAQREGKPFGIGKPGQDLATEIVGI